MIAVRANVANKTESERLFAESKQAFGKLDILVNNAGIYETAPLGQITDEHFHRLFDLNVLGLILTTQEALNHFGPEGGSIINVSSIVSTLSPADQSVYNADLRENSLRTVSLQITRVRLQGLLRTAIGAEVGSESQQTEAGPGPNETSVLPPSLAPLT
jgi:NAD(P)-dependent dehydrogenase (short-subunit alcohol dehydrogenase family)